MAQVVLGLLDLWLPGLCYLDIGCFGVQDTLEMPSRKQSCVHYSSFGALVGRV